MSFSLTGGCRADGISCCSARVEYCATSGKEKRKVAMESNRVAHANLPTLLWLHMERSSGTGLDFNCNASHSQRARLPVKLISSVRPKALDLLFAIGN